MKKQKNKAKMQYNRCKVCQAGDGRCGMTIDGECLNCRETQKQRRVVVHSWLPREVDEIDRMAKLLD